VSELQDADLCGGVDEAEDVVEDIPVLRVVGAHLLPQLERLGETHGALLAFDLRICQCAASGTKICLDVQEVRQSPRRERLRHPRAAHRWCRYGVVSAGMAGSATVSARSVCFPAQALTWSFSTMAAAPSVPWASNVSMECSR
jgi:hypothetical protein